MLLIYAGFLAYSAAAQETATALAEGTKYVPSPYEPGWEIWAGAKEQCSLADTTDTTGSEWCARRPCAHT